MSPYIYIFIHTDRDIACFPFFYVSACKQYPAKLYIAHIFSKEENPTRGNLAAVVQLAFFKGSILSSVQNNWQKIVCAVCGIIFPPSKKKKSASNYSVPYRAPPLSRTVNESRQREEEDEDEEKE